MPLRGRLQRTFCHGFWFWREDCCIAVDYSFRAVPIAANLNIRAILDYGLTVTPAARGKADVVRRLSLVGNIFDGK